MQQVFIPGQDVQIRIIASIWPQVLKATRPLYSGLFEIAPVKKDEAPQLLVIDHHVQWEEEPITHRRKPQTILSHEIANDILNEWANNGLQMTADAAPGVWILQLPDGRFPDPTDPAQVKAAVESQLAEVREKQGRYLGRLIEQGDIKYADENLRKGDMRMERMACRYMGLERPWLHDITLSSIRICPFCSKANPASAVLCQTCNKVIDADGFARAEADMNEAIKRAREAYVKESQVASKPLPPPIQPTQNKGARA